MYSFILIMCHCSVALMHLFCLLKGRPSRRSHCGLPVHLYVLLALCLSHSMHARNCSKPNIDEKSAYITFLRSFDKVKGHSHKVNLLLIDVCHVLSFPFHFFSFTFLLCPLILLLAILSELSAAALIPFAQQNPAVP